MKNKKIQTLVIASMLAALIAVVTAFIKVPTGINNGYIHFGDSMIYLASCLLPWPYAMATAAIGGGLADFLAGFPIWIIPTAIVKALNTVPFSNKSTKILSKRNFLGVFLSGIVTVGGYFIAESLLYSSETALLSIPYSLVQIIGSAVFFVLVATALDKLKFKERFSIFKQD